MDKTIRYLYYYSLDLIIALPAGIIYIEIDDLERRYEGYMQTITPAIVSPNFTEVRVLFLFFHILVANNIRSPKIGYIISPLQQTVWLRSRTGPTRLV